MLQGPALTQWCWVGPVLHSLTACPAAAERLWVECVLCKPMLCERSIVSVPCPQGHESCCGKTKTTIHISRTDTDPGGLSLA